MIRGTKEVPHSFLSYICSLHVAFRRGQAKISLVYCCQYVKITIIRITYCRVAEGDLEDLLSLGQRSCKNT
jgi:hypothetical protein